MDAVKRFAVGSASNAKFCVMYIILYVAFCVCSSVSNLPVHRDVVSLVSGMFFLSFVLPLTPKNKTKKN
jgi:hypothetical protein